MTERWLAQKTCRMTKIFYPHPHRGKSKELSYLSRKKSRRLIEIITGQNNLHYIQNKVNKLHLLCRFCEEEEETFDHFVFECPCFETYRRERFTNLKVGSHSWSLQDILNFSFIKTINRALSYGKDSSDNDEEL